MGQSITNVDSHLLLIFLRRLMAAWHDSYVCNPDFDPSTDGHIPNLGAMDGLLDFIAVGNVLELAAVLDPSAYAGNNGSRQQSDMGSARSLYRRLQKYFVQNYRTSVAKTPISPLNIFRRYLVEFAAALVVYKEERPHSSGFKSCTTGRVKAKVKSFFQTNYAELVPKLDSLIEANHRWLTWTGPSITIEPWKSPNSGIHYSLDFNGGDALYTVAEKEEEPESETDFEMGVPDPEPTMTDVRTTRSKSRNHKRDHEDDGLQSDRASRRLKRG
jgi:hypothetical protein